MPNDSDTTCFAADASRAELALKLQSLEARLDGFSLHDTEPERPQKRSPGAQGAAANECHERSAQRARDMGMGGGAGAGKENAGSPSPTATRAQPPARASVLERLEKQRHEMRRLEGARQSRAALTDERGGAAQDAGDAGWQGVEVEVGGKDEALLCEVEDRVMAVMMESLSESPIPSPQGAAAMCSIRALLNLVLVAWHSFT